MYWNVTRTLLTLLLMLVFMPVQGMSSTSQHLPEISHSHTNLDLSNNFTLSLIESEIAVPKVPKSENRFSPEVVAIFNYYRNGYAARKDIESEPNNTYPDRDYRSQTGPISLPLLHQVNWKQQQITFHHIPSHHRLSGWKETNALYVALNSQFLI